MFKEISSEKKEKKEEIKKEEINIKHQVSSPFDVKLVNCAEL